MVYETSYESGGRPFVPDTKRGYWAQPNDFIYACLGLAFKVDVFSMTWILFHEIGIFAIFPYLICMALYVVPLFIIQSFLGQFSNSGFVSALRISPLFKGMGYISLALNLLILTYIGIFGAVPLIYLFHSFRPTLPWSCEAYLQWSKDAPIIHNFTVCNNTNESQNDFTKDMGFNVSDEFEYRLYQIPSIMFFRSLFDNYHFLYPETIEFSMSWQMVISMLIIWSLIALYFHKVTNIAKMGQIMRYTILLIVTLLSICILRFAFLAGPKQTERSHFKPKFDDIIVGIASTPYYAASTFGAGWGAIISLSSYNKFNTNIIKYSWLICLGQTLIMAMFCVVTFLLDQQFTDVTGSTFFIYIEHHWVIYLASGSALANIELPNMWCIIFYTSMTLAALVVIIIQLIALLTALFDDFEYLRKHKQVITFGIIGFLALCSIYFCSNHGLTYFIALTADALFTQTVLNLLLILVVLWVYGRLRFQRDIEFMLNRSFSTWRINVLRFIAPLGMLLTLFVALLEAYYRHYFSSVAVGIVAIFLVGIPWIFVPGYAVFGLVQTSGSFCARWKRCCHPTDWYPVEAEDRQRYEEAMGNMDITHQLQEIGEEDV